MKAFSLLFFILLSSIARSVFSEIRAKTTPTTTPQTTTPTTTADIVPNFYQDSFDKVKSRQKDSRLEIGFCIEWSKIPDIIRSSGVFKDDYKSEDSCKKQCVVNFHNCRSVDWTADRKCYHHVNPYPNPSTNSNGSFHWDILTKTCSGRCIEWNRTINSLENEGIIQNDAQTEDMCKMKCIMLFPECLSVDWTIKDGGKISPLCYLHFQKADQINTPGAVHWQMKEVPCAALKKTVSTSIETCAEWLKIPDAKVPQESNQPDITTEDLCKKTCMAFPKCDAIDWRPNEIEKCHLQEEGIESIPTIQAGSDYWRIYRNGKCQVDCADAIRSKDQSQIVEVKNWEGEQQKYFNTLPECRKACLARSNCYGFEWFAKGSEGSRCMLEFVANGTTKSNPMSTYYEVGRTQCKEAAKRKSTFVDVCFKEFISKEDSRFQDQGERYGDAPTVDECKKACFAHSRCYGLNWFNLNTERHRCYLQLTAGGNKMKRNNSVYYQLSAPGSGCRGSCVEWRKTSDTKAKKGDIQNHKTENDCKFHCITKPRTCQSVDWIEAAKTPCVHHAVKEVEELETQTGAVHWKIEAVQCTGTCTVLTEFPGIEKKPRDHQTSITTELMCKIKCMAAFPGCQSLDWTKTGACYHHFNGISTSETYTPTSVHWKLSQVSCQDSCGDWKETSDTKAASGDLQSDISSEDMCKIACMLAPKCTSVDWVGEEEKKCFLSSGKNSTQSTSGTVHWEFTRKKPCQSKTDIVPTLPLATTPTTVEETSTTTTEKTTLTTTVTTSTRAVNTVPLEKATTEGEQKGGSMTMTVGAMVGGVIVVVIVVFVVRRFKKEKELIDDEEKKLLAPKSESPLKKEPDPLKKESVSLIKEPVPLKKESVLLNKEPVPLKKGSVLLNKEPVPLIKKPSQLLVAAGSPVAPGERKKPGPRMKKPLRKIPSKKRLKGPNEKVGKDQNTPKTTP